MSQGNQHSRQAKRKEHNNPSFPSYRPAKKRDRFLVPSTAKAQNLSHGTNDPNTLLAEPNGQYNTTNTTDTLSDVPHHSIIVHSTNCLGTWGAGFAAALRATYPVAQDVYTRHCKSFIQGDNRLPEREALGTCLLIPPQQEKEGTPKVWIACLFTSYSYGNGSKTKPKKDDPEIIIEQTRTALEHLRKQLEMIKSGEYEVTLSRPYGRNSDLRTLRFPKPGTSQLNERSRGAAGQQAGDAENESLKVFENLVEHVYEDKASAAAQGPPAKHAVQKAQAPSRGETKGGLPPPEMIIYSPMFNSGNFAVPWNITQRLIEEKFQGSDTAWRIFPAEGKKGGGRNTAKQNYRR